MTAIELSARAAKEVGDLDKATRKRIRASLEQLRDSHENLDIQALSGRAPWRRLRVGDYRVLFRPMTIAEAAGRDDISGYLVARIVNRRELHRAVTRLPDP